MPSQSSSDAILHLWQKGSVQVSGYTQKGLCAGTNSAHVRVQQSDVFPQIELPLRADRGSRTASALNSEQENPPRNCLPGQGSATPPTHMVTGKMHGKAALITGAASGIGRGLALELAAAGVALTREQTPLHDPKDCNISSPQYHRNTASACMCFFCVLALFHHSHLCDSRWVSTAPLPAPSPPDSPVLCPCTLLQWLTSTVQQQSRWPPRSGAAAGRPSSCPATSQTRPSTWPPFASTPEPGAGWTMRCSTQVGAERGGVI